MRTSKKLFILCLGICLILGLGSMGAFAFEVSTTSGGVEILWAEDGATYHVNSSGGPSGNITALQAAMQTWSDVPSSSFVFVYSGTTSNTVHGANDGMNIVTFGSMGTNGTLAENRFWFYTTTGQLIDSDIRFNTSYSWATDGRAGSYDIQNVGTHELGHSLSLGDLYNSADADKTMYGYASAGETKKRTLHQDDIDGITYLYPDTAAYSLSVSVSPSNGGTVAGSGISCGSDCSETYVTETEVTLTATPASGFIFAGWSGACTGVSSSCTVTVDAAQSVTAAFNVAPPSITVSVPNGGEPWTAGTRQTIRWTYTGSPGNYVRIELYKNEVLNRTISSSVRIGSGGNGSYGWTIPSSQAGGSDYKIKVTSTSNSAYSDMSDSTFTITGQPPPSITVSVPNGGEPWVAGTTQTIRWTYTGSLGTYVRIELYKNEVLNRTISSSASVGSGGNGSYNWAIPSNQAGGSDYKIKVTSTTNSAYSDISDGTFTITGPPPPSITVSVPNGGEPWAAGTTQTMRWTYTGSPGNYVRIELYKNEVLNRTISSSVGIGSGGNGSYNWSIPSDQTGGSDYTIKISSTTNSAYNDISDGTFTITGPPPPSITVSVPNGGEPWVAGTTQTIRWTYTGSPGTNVKIELYQNEVLNRTISSSASVGSGGNGSYNWAIPSNQAGGSDYKIKVTSTTNSAYSDMSDSTFTITGPIITVSMPNGGEAWAAGTRQTIRWTYTGSPGNYVRIELYKNEVLNRTISSSVRIGSGGNGSYGWTIPSSQAGGSDYKIKVTSTSNSAYSDMSDSAFTIQ